MKINLVGTAKAIPLTLLLAARVSEKTYEAQTQQLQQVQAQSAAEQAQIACRCSSTRR
jgi:hypothetical protein